MNVNLAGEIVAANHWVFAATFLTVRLVLTGVAWIWTIPARLFRDRPGWQRAGLAFVCSTLVGFVLTTLSALALAELGIGTPANGRLAGLAMIVIGIVLGIVRDRQAVANGFRMAWPGLLVFWLACAGIMNLQGCGEWVVGGWDPGVYVNQGVQIARTGDYHPDAEPCHRGLTADELALHTRGEPGYLECFPAVAIDPESRVILHYFFRLTPTLISVLAQDGGQRAATRVNLFVGVLAWAAFVGMLVAHRCPTAHVVFSAVLLACHPLWIYQLHLPTTEMVELFFVASIAVLASSRGWGWGPPVWMATAIFAAISNRFSFTPYAGLLLCGIAWGDRERDDRRRVFAERMLHVSAIALGVAFDLTVSGISLARLGDVSRLLPAITVGFVLVALAVDSVGSAEQANRFSGRLPRWLLPACGILLVLAIAAGWYLRSIPRIATLEEQMARLLPFFGPAAVALALPGVFLLLASRDGGSRTLKGIVTALIGITGIVLIKNFIAPIYPWATRRYLAETVPLLAVAGGYVLARLWACPARWGWAGRWVAVILLIGVVAANGRRSWHAWSCTEYDGLSGTLAELAARIGPSDIVVSDHHKWGTPLMAFYGKQALDGRYLCFRKDRTGMEKCLEPLERFRREGRRVLFLTSTTAGLDIYPFRPKAATLEWKSRSVTYREIIHGKRVRDFALREKAAVFALYRWEGGGGVKPSSPGGPDGDESEPAN